MTGTPMQKAVRLINEARELGRTEVDLSGLEIQEIPEELRELADTLESLYLCYTKASDISPLANLTKLQELYLWGTGVSDISPLANLTSLRVLGFDLTNVSDISPLANLPNLQAVDLSRGPLVESPANIQALKKLIKNGCYIEGVEEMLMTYRMQCAK